MDTNETGKIISYIYPQTQNKKAVADNDNKDIFACGCSFYKIILLFFIGAFLGDLVETISCRITMGVWMSRTSVVWGRFSIVWGLALAAATALLYRHRNRSVFFLFWMGTLLGGIYEYACSVFTEVAFGTIFWDYRRIPFNLDGRVNLLYCLCWGIVAVVWFEKLYPLISDLIERIPKKPGLVLTWLLLGFMIGNLMLSGAVLARYNARGEGIAADNALAEWIDQNYDDERMKLIYPNAKPAAGMAVMN